MANRTSKAAQRKNPPQEPETGSTPVPFVPSTHVGAYCHLDTDPKRGSVTAHEETVAAACTALIREAKAAHYLLFTRALEDANLFPDGESLFGKFRKEQLGAIDADQAPRSYEWEETAPTYLRVVRVWVGIVGGLPSLATGPDDPRFPDGAFPTVDSAIRRGFPDVGMPVVTNDGRYRRWAEEYLAEVRAFMGKFDSDPNALGAAMAMLVEGVASFTMGHGEGAGLVTVVRSRGRGADILEALDRNKAELVRMLKAIPAALAEGVGALRQAKATHKPAGSLTLIEAGLLHAYERLGGEKSMNIDHTNDAKWASHYGYDSPSSGETLRGHFDRYYKDQAERIGDVVEHIVRRRLLKIYPLLSPNAKAMAKLEGGKIGIDPE